MEIDSQCIPDDMKDEENTLLRHCSDNGVEYVAPRPDEDEIGTQLRRHMLRMQVKWYVLFCVQTDPLQLFS